MNPIERIGLPNLPGTASHLGRHERTGEPIGWRSRMVEGTHRKVLMRRLLIVAAALALMAAAFPTTTIPLPYDFAPEGIAVGEGTTFYAGSLNGGTIVSGKLASGDYSVLVDDPATDVTVGLAVDDSRRLLFAAGGPSGMAAVYDSTTGATVASAFLGDGFINDVIVTRDGAYFTNSFVPVFYFLPVSRSGVVGAPETMALSGPALDSFVAGTFNYNGIEATANGRNLIVVNSATGELFKVDPASGASAVIDLGGQSVSSGDGILLQGRTLYVVRNFLNEVAVVRLHPSLASGEVVDSITNPAFEVPTTIARSGSRLVVVNAQFGFPVDPANPPEVVVFR